MTKFKIIQARAAKRKGGQAALTKLLPKAGQNKTLARLKDGRALSEMAKRIFCAGFVWSVVEKKWPAFEEAFLEFGPAALLDQPNEFWDDLIKDTRIVRNAQKIMAVRKNAQFVSDISAEHGSFGKFLNAWPANDQVGLLDVLAKRGSRLGGHTGQYLLRFLGKDSFILSTDVVICLRDAGLDIAESPTSKRDLRAIQAQFNTWSEESGLSLTHLSRICAMSVGENYDAETIMARGRGPE